MEDLVGVVLAAGIGTRLRPLTDLRPKALCPVNNVALLDLALDRVVPHVVEVAVNAHHRWPEIEAHVGDRAYLSVEMPTPLGTAGAIGHLRGWIDGRPVMVTNGDAWLRGDVAPLIYGWDGNRVRLAVVGDIERPDFGSTRYAGICLLPAGVAANLEPQPSSLYEEIWRPGLDEGSLDLVDVGGPFFDCGTPEEYLAANLEASGGESVIGPGAVVFGDVIRSVVWPGGVVRAGEVLIESIRAGDAVTVAAGLTRPG